MKTKIKRIIYKSIHQLVSPYTSIVKVENAVMQVGRGSFSAMGQLNLYRPELIEKPTLLVNIGQYCEFNSTCTIVLGGEHLVGDCLVNTFSDSFQIRQQIKNKSFIEPSTKGPVAIGNNVILSAGSIVLSGSIIKDNVLVAAGALVNGNFESNQVIGGVPAKKLCNIKAPEIAWWDMAEECISEYIQTQKVLKTLPNRTKDLRLVFDGQLNKEGKIGALNLSGLMVKEKFISIAEFSEHHLAYFRSANSDETYITVSDEVFDDLL
jgi:acetyltransferase-like isoleucine patch superfamily enzyme